jgi:hypothetical protein
MIATVVSGSCVCSLAGCAEKRGDGEGGGGAGGGGVLVLLGLGAVGGGGWCGDLSRPVEIRAGPCRRGRLWGSCACAASGRFRRAGTGVHTLWCPRCVCVCVSACACVCGTQTCMCVYIYVPARMQSICAEMRTHGSAWVEIGVGEGRG